MNVTIAATVENDYLLIKASGDIVDIEELKRLTKRLYDEILEYGRQKIIIDERNMQFPASLEHSIELVKFLSENFPAGIKHWKIAQVVARNFKAIADFWEFHANRAGYGYKVFCSMEDAVLFIAEGQAGKTENNTPPLKRALPDFNVG